MAALAVTIASVLKSAAGTVITATAGGTITQGQAVYVDTANSNVIKAANAQAAGGIAADVAGISLNSALTGQPVSYVAIDTAFAHGFSVSDVAAGQVVYLDDTAGNMTVTFADLDVADYVVDIGVINATETTMDLRPRTKVVKA